MDLAKTMIRSVARSFYDTSRVLVIDALMVHSASVEVLRKPSIEADRIFQVD